MQSIEIAKRQIMYNNTLTLTYTIKITKTEYYNKQAKKRYTRYKIRIPEELQQVLQDDNVIYFKKIDNLVHINTRKDDESMYKCKIQKNMYNQRVEYSFNLSKKVFNLKDKKFFCWTIKLNNNTIKDSVAQLI